MSPSRKRLYVIHCAYFLIVLAIAVAPPSVSAWNKLHPHVIGLPFAQFVVISIALLLIVGLASFFISEGVLNNRERRERMTEGQVDGH